MRCSSTPTSQVREQPRAKWYEVHFLGIKSSNLSLDMQSIQDCVCQFRAPELNLYLCRGRAVMLKHFFLVSCFVVDKPMSYTYLICLTTPSSDVPGIPGPEHWPIFLLIWSYQQSPAGFLSTLTAVYLHWGNSPYASTTPRAGQLTLHGLHKWPLNPGFWVQRCLIQVSADISVKEFWAHKDRNTKSSFAFSLCSQGTDLFRFRHKLHTESDDKHSA